MRMKKVGIFQFKHLQRGLFKLGVFALFSLFVFMNAFSQISVDLKKLTIRQALKTIEKNSSYQFFYNDDMKGLDKKVFLSVQNKDIDFILSELFYGTNISYRKEKNNLVVLTEEGIVSKEKGLSSKFITGSVKDKSGEPIIGANVLVKGTSVGTITDFNGNYSIEVLDGSVLQFSFIGYNSQDVKVGKNKVVNVVMAEDTQNLDEVVIVGYGSQKKVNLTGAIATVKMDDVIGNRPVGNTAQALAGVIPGLQISHNNGKPGTTINMNVRGATSINDNSNGAPLVLVDNVPMDIDLLDPNDIESVTTLKDAAASAIYGARAAFGVILITTKQGKKDSPMRVSYNNNFSFSKPASLLDKVDPYRTVKTYSDMGLDRYYGGQDTKQWLQYIDEYHNGQHQEGYLWSDGVRYSLAPTDVIDEMMAKAGFQHQHNISLTGGTDKTTYRVSFGMIDENGILTGDKDTYKRYNTSAFVSMEANKWLTAQADIRYTDAKTSTAMGGTSEYGDTGIWSFAKGLPTMAPLGYGYATENDTELLPFGTPANILAFSTPKINRNNNIRILGRILLKPIKDLEIIGEYSFNRGWESERTFNDKFKFIETVTGEKKDAYNTSTYKMYQAFETTNAINIYATYNKEIGAHSFSVMGGYNQESWYRESLQSSRQDPIDQRLPSISQSTGVIESEDHFYEYALRSLFYRLNYSYKGKYLVEANGRYDGSSRFPKKDRFGFFPSFSAGWRVSEEPFMEGIRTYVDNLKIRASWGSIGNQNVDYYAYLATMAAKNDLQWILPGSDKYVTTLDVPGLVSSSFTWETVNTLDVGVDINLFNRLGIVFDWYKRDTKDMLTTAKPLPSVLGTTAPKVNAANMTSKGWELSLNWNDRIGKVKYNIGFNIYDSKSKITEYSNDDQILMYVDSEDGVEKMYYRKDMEFGEIWGYQTDRFYTENDFIDGKLKDEIPAFRGQNRDNVQPGDILYKDLDGDGEISNGDNSLNNPGDLCMIGNSTPRFQYSIMGGLSYADFDLSFLFSGVGKRDLWINELWIPSGQFPKSIERYQIDYWTEDNPDAFYPRLYGEGGNDSYNHQRQSKYLYNGAYIRLKNVTLGYNLPKKVCSRLHIQKFRIFVSGENLFTIHHLPEGYYPDTYDMSPGSNKINASIEGDSSANGWSYPLMRQYSFGINLTF